MEIDSSNKATGTSISHKPSRGERDTDQGSEVSLSGAPLDVVRTAGT